VFILSVSRKYLSHYSYYIHVRLRLTLSMYYSINNKNGHSMLLLCLVPQVRYHFVMFTIRLNINREDKGMALSPDVSSTCTSSAKTSILITPEFREADKTTRCHTILLLYAVSDILFTLSPPNKSAKCIVFFHFQSASMLLKVGETDV